MQNSKSSNTRKPWYQRAMEIAKLWRTAIPKSPEIRRPSPPLPPAKSKQQQLRKCTSLKVATSFTRVCLCAPIAPYDDVFRAYAPPRRSSSYPPATTTTTTTVAVAVAVASQRGRVSTDTGRRIFRGKSLRENASMRRFVVEEEAMMQIRRRNQMEVVRRRNLNRRKKLGPSPLSRMVLAEELQGECHQ